MKWNNINFNNISVRSGKSSVQTAAFLPWIKENSSPGSRSWYFYPALVAENCAARVIVHIMMYVQWIALITALKLRPLNSRIASAVKIRNETNSDRFHRCNGRLIIPSSYRRTVLLVMAPCHYAQLNRIVMAVINLNRNERRAELSKEKKTSRTQPLSSIKAPPPESRFFIVLVWNMRFQPKYGDGFESFDGPTVFPGQMTTGLLENLCKEEEVRLVTIGLWCSVQQVLSSHLLLAFYFL